MSPGHVPYAEPQDSVLAKLASKSLLTAHTHTARTDHDHDVARPARGPRPTRSEREDRAASTLSHAHVRQFLIESMTLAVCPANVESIISSIQAAFTTMKIETS